MSWKDWLDHNTDKFILVALFVALLLLVLHLIHSPGTSPENLSWAREAAGTVLGAIIGMITGQSLAARRAAQEKPKE